MPVVRARLEHRVRQRRQIVGDEDLLEQPPGDQPRAVAHLLAGDGAREVDLRQQARRAQDRSGDQVREVGDEHREVDQVAGRPESRGDTRR